MENNKNKRKYSRRTFLEAGVNGSVGIAIGLVAGTILNGENEEQPEMVRLLTADGKMVEVEKKRIPETCGRPVAVSNQVLQAWMEEGKP